jgi:outer membrane biosynthesis protein TonB
VKVKIDKTLAASIALHVLVLGWGLVSFSTKAFEMEPEESVAVDVVSADQLAHVMAGMKSGKKENPKPLVEKVAEAKPVEDAVGKITEKAPVVTDTTPPPQPKVEEKPVEKKPDPPKPVAESKPKEEPKEAPKPRHRRNRNRKSRKNVPSISRRSPLFSTSVIRRGRPPPAIH